MTANLPRVLIIPPWFDGLPYNTGSGVIRCKWVANHWRAATIYDRVNGLCDECLSAGQAGWDAYIFSKAYRMPQTVRAIQQLFENKKSPYDRPTLILDLCDPVWIQGQEGALRDVLPMFDAATAPTRNLAEWPGRTVPSYVVPDRIDPDALPTWPALPACKARRGRRAGRPACLWFGYSDNYASLEPVFPYLKERNVYLHILSDKPPPEGWSVDHTPFTWQALFRIMQATHFVLNPPSPTLHGIYKSDNKTKIANAMGRLVAHKRSELFEILDMLETDMEGLIQESARVAEFTREEHHVRKSGEQYEQIIEKIQGGGYDLHSDAKLEHV